MQGATTTTSQAGPPTPRQRAERRRFFADLVASGRFCRDTPLGGILHPGTVSLREISDGDSLHVCVGPDDVVSVHVDHFSPVAGGRPDGQCRYSVRAVLTHLVAHVRQQCHQARHGSWGRHRCRLECELVDTPEDEAACVQVALESPEPAPAASNEVAAG